MVDYETCKRKKPFELIPSNSSEIPEMQNSIRLEKKSGRIMIVFIKSLIPFDKKIFEKAQVNSGNCAESAATQSDSVASSDEQTGDAPKSADTGQVNAGSTEEHANAPKPGEGHAETNQPKTDENTGEADGTEPAADAKGADMQPPKDTEETGPKVTPEHEDGPENTSGKDISGYSYYDPERYNYFFMHIKIFDDKYSDQHNLEMLVPTYLQTKVTTRSGCLQDITSRSSAPASTESS